MSDMPATPESGSHPSPWPYFPKAILSVSRKEHYQQPLSLHIYSRRNESLQRDQIEPSSADFLNPKYWQNHSFDPAQEYGPLPNDLKGHVFIIGTAGSFDSQRIEGTDHIYLPTQDGWQHIYSGDGMIYRLDFHPAILSPSREENDPQTTTPTQVQHSGWANLATRLIKTPDYYADLALETNQRYQDWPNYTQSMFKDAALTRLSINLGGRNYLNTAWLPLKPKNNKSERLLVTWDAGRPYEIDPLSLALVAPVGLHKDWQPTFDITGLSRRLQNLPGLSNFFSITSHIFPMILSSAHPVYDDHEDAVYIINGTKSLNSLLQISRLAPYFKKGFLQFLTLRADPEQNSGQKASWIDQILLALLSLILWISQIFFSCLSLLGVGGRDHLFLYRWHSDQTAINPSDKWEVVDEKGWPIAIYQSGHQMALTKDYIIISDSSFKFVMADVLPSLLNPQDLAKNIRIFVNSAIQIKNLTSKLSEPLPIPTPPKAKTVPQPELGENFRGAFQFLFSFLNYPQTPYTDIYVVPRSTLNSTSGSVANGHLGANSIPKIKAYHFRIEPETAHFLANYDNPDHKVVLHVGHIQGLDPAEFVNKIDESIDHYCLDTHTAQPTAEATSQHLQDRSGVLANSMAPNQIGVWILDLKTGKPEKVILAEDDTFQLLAFFTLNEKTSDQMSDVYWNCGGAWPNHHTLNHFDLYKSQIEPKILDQQLNRIAKEGRPSSLLRVSQVVDLDSCPAADRAKLRIADCYAFPPGCYSSSPQFVPKAAGGNDATHGYIVCVVVATDNWETDREEDKKLSELWIFDAADLSQGPLYRLSHPELNIGPTLHTAWLSKLESPPPRTDYDLRADYREVLQQLKPEDFKKRVQDLFEQDVFPNAIAQQ